jgi:hypothetical protein
MSRNAEFHAQRETPLNEQLGHPNLNDAYGPDIGYVHRDDLKKLQGNDYRYDPAELAPSIESEGIKEPIHVGYNPVTGQGKVEEGNHRVAAAMQTSRQFLPVVAHRSRVEMNTHPMQEQEGFPRENRAGIPKEDQYVKGDFHPKYLFPGAK